MENLKILDKNIYGSLLASFQPKVIETEAENELYLAEVEKLMALEDKITPEQEQLMKLLVTLIEQFEEQYYQLKPAKSHEIIYELMLAKSLKQEDLLKIFDSQDLIADAIAGKISISKTQATALGELFHVSPTLFIE
jgi:HTH-type transcriptional regulator / antitoxin HigA